MSVTRRAVTGAAVAAAALLLRWASAGAQDPPPPRPEADAPTTAPTTRPLSPLAPGERRVAVRFTGGHDTDGRDRGRPVVLIAAALKVPADVFRQTFTHVRPAGPGSGGPTDAEARQNKATLLKGLSPYGVTNDRLDAVSNYYRYPPGRGQLWRHRAAIAYAVVGSDGKFVRFELIDGGAGYSTPPTVTVDGLPAVTVSAMLSFGTDLVANGAIQSLAASDR